MKKLLILLLLLLIAAPGAAQQNDPYSQARQLMVQSQIEARGVRDPLVLKAMSQVPRHQFVPPDRINLAYADHPLPIGFGQTISQPYIVAFMSEALKLKGGEKVLEIGTGSGYQAAVLEAMGAQVFSIEIVGGLFERVEKRFASLGLQHIKLLYDDGYFGWPEEAPFDAIIVTCAAGHIPPPLIKQLAPGGRMIIPVGPPLFVQELVLAQKDAKGRVTTQNLLPVRFVPLVRERK